MKSFRTLIVFAAIMLFGGCASASPLRLHGQAVTSYPLSVILSGNQTVYDFLVVKPGPVGALVPASGYCASIGGCAAGLTYTASPPALNITTGTKTISGIDMTGNGLFVTGASTTGNASNILLSNASGYLFNCEANSGGAGVAAMACNIDHFTADNSTVSNVTGPFNVIGTAGFGYFHDAYQDYVISHFPATIDHSYFAMFGQRELVAAHSEFGQFWSSTTVSYSFFNALDGGPATGGSTGTWQFQSATGNPQTDLVTHVIAIGNRTQISHQTNGNPSVGLGPVVVCKAVGGDVTMSIDHSVFQTSQAAPNDYLNGLAEGVITFSGLVGGPFVVNETITSGVKTAKVAVVSPLTITPNTGSKLWNGTFAPGDVIVGTTSGASATIVTVSQGSCRITDGGFNYDWDTNALIVLSGTWGFP